MLPDKSQTWRQSHIDASHSRQPLVKGERLVRYEVNAVKIDPRFLLAWFAITTNLPFGVSHKEPSRTSHHQIADCIGCFWRRNRPYLPVRDIMGSQSEILKPAAFCKDSSGHSARTVLTGVLS